MQIRAKSVTPRAARGSGVSTGTLVQRPSIEGQAQKRHCPPQASLQQTPSVQKPMAHSSLRAQLWPRPRLPQLPPLQTAGATQSLFSVQVTLHAPSVHLLGAHPTGEPGTHVPLPSQTLAGIRLSPAQLAALHTLPDAYFAQPPWPLQEPEKPQLALPSSLHIRRGSVAPSSTGLHAPILAIWLQLIHAPVQATLQQTPSAQKPESHSSLPPHFAPSGLFPQLPPAQVLPSHWVLLVQAAKQALLAGSHR